MPETSPRATKHDYSDDPTRRPRRVTQAEIIRALLEGGSTEHSSVSITRNARGVVQLEVTCRTDRGSGVETIDQAEQVAAEVFDRLRERYPYSDGEGGAA